ncbi:efflux RND transporter periplasmic adaptor subunit [Agaribacter marinus]|uniref:ABC transporter permease n=1 Tax=Agaribacter marinus TaxID=1431249 RepID=A0AA37SU48_9ALTE|nr:HlyD family efflux transporter periplasmic adaptor subunit [Agaribacter marinus]GLR69172.1 ABC transporter permease [Agaribacter marinus]
MDKKIKKPSRFSKQNILILFIVIACVYAATRFLPEQANAQRVKQSSLITSTARKANFEDYIPLRVRIEPLKTVFLDAIEGGRVEALYVEEGEYVKKGQPLLKLSNTTLQLDLISREAQVSEQLNNLRNTNLAMDQYRLNIKRELVEIDYQIQLATLKLKRRQKVKDFLDVEGLENLQAEIGYLQKRKALTIESQKQEEASREAQVAQLKTSIGQLEQNLLIARANLENLLVKAPRTGQLTSFELELGESRSRGERLGQIDDIENYKATGFISEFYLNRLSLGQLAKTVVNGQKYTLRLHKIYPKITNREFEVDLVFVDTHPDNIRRGQTLTPKLELSAQYETLLIDNGSFMQQSGGNWIFVLNEDGTTASRRNIEIGRQTPSQIEIIKGLYPGDVVIVSNYKNYLSAENLMLNNE